MAIHFVKEFVLLLCLSFVYSQVAYEDAVFIALTKNLDGDADPVRFDHEGIDVQGSYDPVGGRFFCMKKGTYWVALSAGIKPRKTALYRLYKNEELLGSVHRLSNTHTGNDTFSRDTIVSMDQMNTLRVRSYQVDGLFSDYGMQSSLSVFRLTDLMNKSTETHFSVCRQRNADGRNGEILPFPEITVNVGKGFQPADNIFKAPREGNYFFSYSVGVKAGDKSDTVLRRNVRMLGALERNNTLANEIDMLSRAGMYHLNAGDLVYVSLPASSEVISKGLDRHVSFQGFLYDPAHGSPVAFSVKKTSAWRGAHFLHIPFEEVGVNVGDGWKDKSNSFFVPVSGIYYLTVTVGANIKDRVYVSVLVNGARAATIVRTGNNHNGVDVMSRSLILLLNKDDLVYLGAEPNTAVFSNKEGQTTFTGFLLYTRP